MILKRLRLRNFRQFKGEQEISFAPSGSENVTVIHAENGFGKTALLNALHWGFWGKMTSDMPIPENLITECLATAGADKNLEAAVEIEYTHDDDEFFLKRSITLASQRHDHRNTNLELHKVERGTLQKIDSPAASISNQIPEAMGELFFFNGENLSQFANESKSDQIREAIYNVLGLELMEKAIDRAKKARSLLNQDLNKHADADMQRKIEDLQKYDEEIKQLEDDLKLIGENQVALEGDNSTIEKKLEATHDSRLAQEKRNGLKQNLDSTRESLEAQDAVLIKLIAEKAYYLFSSNLTSQGEEIVNRLEEEGKIPAKFTATVLEKLLENGKCICDADLAKGTPHREAIERLIGQAADRSLDEATQTIKTALATLQGNAENLRDEFKEAKGRRDDLIRSSNQLAAEIKEISRKIGESENIEVQELEHTRETNAQRIQTLKIEASRKEESISDKEKFREALRVQIRKSKQGNEKAQALQRQIKVLDDAIDLMVNMLEAEREDLREELNKEIKQHFGDMIIKDYEADLNDQFRLRILKKSTEGDLREVGRSTGEKQITSLVFIASLIGLARRRKQIPTILEGLWGGDLPMVMDSPYGQLGGYYRGEITKWLPTVAPQVVIFVSDSQWRGEVEDALAGKIGKEYLLEYHAQSIHEKASDEATIRGVNHTQFFKDEDEYTLIKPI
jgi:DNA sulfur modification protein DndD